MKKKAVYIITAAVVLVVIGLAVSGPYKKWRKGQTDVSSEEHIEDKGADRSVEDEIDRDNLTGEQKDHADTMDEEKLDGIDTSDVKEDVLKKLSLSRKEFNKKIDTFANENGITALEKVYSYGEIYDESGEVTVPLFFDGSYEEEKDPNEGEEEEGRINFDFVYQKDAGTYLCRLW